MAATNQWTEWHLTPRGWTSGSSKTDGLSAWVDPPRDRVKTCVYKELVSSPPAPMTASLTTQFVSNHTERVAQLEAEHGECPRRL
jgi:hypothetical protein